MGPILGIIIGIAAIIAGIGVAVIKYSKQQREKLIRIADNLGMQIIDKGMWHRPELVGVYRDRELRMKNIYHSTGKSGYYTYRVTIRLEGLDAFSSPINISNLGRMPGLFTSIGRAFTSRTITFDHEEFDSKVIVKAPDEMEARQIIDMEVQQDVLNIGRGTTAVKDGTVYFEAYGTIQQHERRIPEILTYLFKMEEKLLRIKSPFAKTDPEYAGSYSNKSSPFPDVSTNPQSTSTPEMTFWDEDDSYYKGE